MLKNPFIAVAVAAGAASLLAGACTVKSNVVASDAGPLNLCGTIEPCGGSIVGSWTIADSCENSIALRSGLAADCPSAFIDASTVKTTGTYVFDVGGTYTATTAQTGTLRLVAPPSCFGGTTCADVVTSLQDPTTNMVTCTGTTTCTCLITPVGTQSMTDTGTYGAAGSVVTLSSNSNGVTDQPFCVRGTTLHIVDLDTTTNMGPMGKATITRDIVLNKR